ncbi:MAG: dTDP-4-dehydrorhamnose reductase [Alphaproteobacteria bacterium]|nr:dTDP-4-dehydrorhamnose reductase [Alphaproteobacteria bacterium]
MSEPRRILVTGAGGQVGHALLSLPPSADLELVGADRAALDIRRSDQVIAALTHSRAELVINLAAYTAVDKAEDEPLEAMAVNRDGAGLLAQACQRRGSALIQVSTDYVFDGARAGAWRPGDKTAPLGVYGRSKAEGEELVRDALPAHVILRTSWVFGAHGGNFVRTMLGRIGKQTELRVVDDQRGCPTAADDLARALVAIARAVLADPSAVAGTYHYCNAGSTTWYRFAQAIFARAASHGLEPPRLVPVPTAAYPTRARRPANSELDCATTVATFAVARPSWRDSLPPVVDAILGRR